MLDVMEFEVTCAKSLPQAFRMFEHPQVAFADLGDASIRARPEHRRRNQGGFRCLHRLMPQYPRLPIVSDMLDILQCYAGVIETEFDSAIRKTAMVLFSGESFLFSGSDQLSVMNKSGGRIAKCCKAKDVHL